MTQRSPMNDRYQKHTKPAGQTRRSASSAKPKRVSGTAASSKSAPSKSAPPVSFEPSPEYKYWRNIWWGILGVGALLALGYLPLYYFHAPTWAGYVLLVIAYAFLGVAIWIDFKKIKPMRDQLMAEQRAGKSAKAPKPAEQADMTADSTTTTTTVESEPGNDDADV